EKAPKGALAEIVLLAGEAGTDALEPALERARVLSGSVDLVRDLVNTPPNLLPPAEFARRAEELVADLPITVTVLVEAALAAGSPACPPVPSPSRVTS